MTLAVTEALTPNKPNLDMTLAVAEALSSNKPCELAKFLFSAKISLPRWRISLLRLQNFSSPLRLILRINEILSTEEKYDCRREIRQH